jgi:hypothetical protein
MLSLFVVLRRLVAERRHLRFTRRSSYLPVILSCDRGDLIPYEYLAPCLSLAYTLMNPPCILKYMLKIAWPPCEVSKQGRLYHSLTCI